jgi:glycosyltransferase involved in cell wall biosynthesis
VRARDPHPRVSVITIFLNEEDFLDEAIRSVLGQSFSDWELLLVDDGSTDRSAQIAREHAGRDSRIVYLEHPGRANRGMSATRNLALARARGDYTAFLDGDDAWPEDALDREVALLVEHPTAAMACGTTLWWHSWRAERSAGDACDVIAARAPVRGAPINAPSFAALVVRDGAAAPCMCSTIVRTGALRQVGGFDTSFRGLYEDQVMYVKIGLRHPVVVSTECIDRYRQHERQRCVEAAAAGEVSAAHKRFLNWFATYATSRGIGEAQLAASLPASRAVELPLTDAPA